MTMNESKTIIDRSRSSTTPWSASFPGLIFRLDSKGTGGDGNYCGAVQGASSAVHGWLGPKYEPRIIEHRRGTDHGEGFYLCDCSWAAR